MHSKNNSTNPYMFDSKDILSGRNDLHFPPSLHKKPSLALHLISSYLDIGYFLCFFPYRFKFNSKIQQYEFHEFRIQKVLSLCFHMCFVILSVFVYTCILLDEGNTLKSMKPVKFAQIIFSVIYVVVFSYAVLQVDRFQHFFKKAVNCDERNDPWLEKIGWTFKSYLWHIGIFLVFIVAETVHLFIGFSFVGGKTNSMRNLLGSQPAAISNCTLDVPFLSLENKCVDIFDFIMLLFSYLRAIGESPSILLFAFGWYLRELYSNLNQAIKKGNLTISQIMERYLFIKEKNAIINDICSVMVILFIIGSVPFISDFLSNLDLDVKHIIALIIFTGYYLMSMLGSAEANKKARDLKTSFLHYIHKRSVGNGAGSTQFDDDNLIVNLLHTEFQSADVGLHGMQFFTITYSFVGVMLSQVIVYALIIIQLKQDENKI